MARILVAESDSSLGEFLAQALNRTGHEVVTVGDGLAALESLGMDRFDLLVAEEAMPGLDGITLALKVDKDFPGTRILMITASQPQPHHAHNLTALVHGIIEKPFSFDQIHRCVEAALKGNPS